MFKKKPELKPILSNYEVIISIGIRDVSPAAIQSSVYTRDTQIAQSFRVYAPDLTKVADIMNTFVSAGLVVKEKYGEK